MSEKYTHAENQNSLASSAVIGHKVALIGQYVFCFTDLPHNALNLENASVSTFALPNDYEKIGSLSDYTLVICDYEAFHDCLNLQSYFFTQMIEALDKGANFCFVHYSSAVPQRDSDPATNLRNTQEIVKKQIGFQTIYDNGINVHRTEIAYHSGSIIRNVFKPFLDKWGVSHIYFVSTEEDNQSFDDVIYKIGKNNELVQGFAKNIKRGRVIFLPFQRDTSRRSELINGIKILIDCLLTYITESQTQLPEWANYSFFTDENQLINERVSLEKKLEAVNNQLGVFEEAKSLLLQSKYNLENTLPRFLTDNFNLKIERNEKYSEDFWLLSENGKRVAIAEIKSIVKGFKKGAIYSALTHRDENGLDEKFPTLLFANANLQAGSWKDKDRIIDKQDYQFAAQEGVLIIRIEDVVRLWDAIRNKKIDKSEILQLFLNNKGWLQITPDLQVKVEPQLKKTKN